MSEYKYRIHPMEGDYFRALSPADILKKALDSVLEDIRRDGCDRDVMFPLLNAVWMISRMRFFQHKVIKIWDELVVRTFPRVIENGRYIMYVEMYVEDELVVEFDAAFMAVNAAQRKTMNIELLEPLWNVPPREAQSKYLMRMDMEADYRPGGRQMVRLSDCDGNRHLTSPGYIDLICNELRFWQGDPRPMEFIQIDYASEVMPETEIRFETAEKDGMHLVRGYKEDGKLAFSAKCKY